jgi:replicative DNA helicase
MSRNLVARGPGKEAACPHGTAACGSLALRSQPLEQLVESLIARLAELHEAGAHPVSGISTGFHDLDRLTTGMHNGELIVVASRPSIGKSSFAQTIAQHVALEQELPVVLFSLEMDRHKLLQRMASSSCGIQHQLVRTGALGNADWVRLSENIDRLGRAMIFVEDAPTMTLDDVRSLAHEHAERVGRLGLIVVDSLQLMNGRDTIVETRAVELSGISRGLKALARELQCPLIAVCQLNRNLEARRDKRPMLGDLRDSGAIEEDADVVLFIHRDDYYNKMSKEPGVAEIIIGKQRNGPVGTVKLAFLERLTRFDNVRTIERATSKRPT